MNALNNVHIVGSINMDVVASTTRHPRPGETVHGDSLDYYPGGKGANQAVAAARLDAKVHMVGRVGADAAGDQLRSFLASTGVDVSQVATTPEAPTGTALIVVAGGENTIVVVAGANGLLTPEDCARVELSEADVVVAQFETPQRSTMALFEKARAVGATTILNPAPASTLIEGLGDLCDVIVVNESELATLAGLSEPVNVENLTALESTVRSLQTSSMQTWVVTLGAAGLVAFDQSSSGPIQLAGHAVEPVDTTGAGDCFVGAFAAYLASGVDIADCLARANAAAAICVQRPGAGPSMPTADEVAAALS